MKRRMFSQCPRIEVGLILIMISGAGLPSTRDSKLRRHPSYEADVARLWPYHVERRLVVQPGPFPAQVLHETRKRLQ